MTAALLAQQAQNYHRSLKKHQSQYKEVDIYSLDAKEMAQLWVAVRKSDGLREEQITEKFNELSGLDLTTATLKVARDFGGSANDLRILSLLAKDLARSGNILSQYYTTTQGGKQYIIFKGNQRLRKVISGTRYLATNTKMMKMGIGGQAVKAAAKSGFIVSVVFSTSLNSVRWIFEDDYRWSNWLGNLSTDAVKIAIAGVFGYLTAAAFTMASASAIPVLIPLGLGIAVCLGMGYALNRLDSNLGITESIIDVLEDYERQAKSMRGVFAEGIYYLIEAPRKYVEKQTRKYFVDKFRKLKGGLAPQWR